VWCSWLKALRCKQAQNCCTRRPQQQRQQQWHCQIKQQQQQVLGVLGPVQTAGLLLISS
jgi:hypothetical protein